MIVTGNVSNIELTWDLAINNYNLLYAEGGFDTRRIKLLQHTFYANTKKSFDLHRSEKYPPAPEDESKIYLRIL